MSTVQNNKIKKNNTLGIKPKKKTIPININTNPVPGKFLFSNQVNNIASSYLSMGRRIQINKNNKTSKIIHVNTNSATNYYTLNSKDSKVTNGSLTNSLFTNCKNNNMSDINTLNNYFNVSNSNSNNHNQYQNYEMNHRMKNISKEKKHLSTLSNSHISNDKLINGYQNSNNGNNSKLKNKINNSNTIYNLSKLRQTYSTRPNFLDSRNKTKKVPMKSKIRQFKYQYKNKSISTSFNNNIYSTKRRFKGSHQRDIYNYMREELLNNLSNEKKLDSNYDKKINCNYIHKNKTLYEIKNRHFRNNTVNFGGKELLNIFHKKTLSNLNNNINNNKINYAKININKNIYINNENNNINNNLKQIRNSVGKNQNSVNNEENPFSHNLINKINIGYNSKKKAKILSKGKINDIKICINDKKINLKETRHSQNNNSNIININYNNNHIIINKNISNNNSSNNSNVVHHIKHPISNNINISGIKKILIRKESKKLSQNQNQNPNKINNNKLIPSIPTPGQKIKNNIIPSQRNIKINLTKYLQNTKSKQNNKLIAGRKTLSIKKMPKENNSDFSISQLNGKLSNKLIKNNNNENINEENAKNKGIIENKKMNENELKNHIDGIIGIDTNCISNIKNKNKNKSNNKNKVLDNKSENITEDLINDIYHYNLINNKKKKNNYNNINCNSSNSTVTNNINYGNIKNDYSVDNVPEPINKINKKNQNDYYSVNNIIDLNNSNLNSDNNNIKEDKTKNNCKEKRIKENEEKKEIDKKKITDNDKNKDDNTENNRKNKKDEKKNNIKSLNDKENNEIIINKNIHNNLFDEENLDELPEDYDENFNDLYSIINKINFGSVLVCVEGFFTPEGRAYKRYKDKFDKSFDKLFNKRGYSFSNSNNKPKKIIEVAGLTSNTKTNSSSSKKKVVSPNAMYNDLNIVKELNVNC